LSDVSFEGLKNIHLSASSNIHVSLKESHAAIVLKLSSLNLFTALVFWS
jgi:hypothetical protein